MVTKEELYKLIVYFAAALTASIIRFMRNNKQKTFTLFLIEMLLGASFAFFIVPGLVEYFHLSLYVGTGLTWILTMFSETVLSKIEVKLNKKMDDVSDITT